MPLNTPEPTGVVKVYAGSTAPAGYLLCDGTAVSRTTYAALYAVCGTSYGTGDGSTTFNLPDLRGRAPVGVDSGQTEFSALGTNGGAKTHTHTSAAHSHALSDAGQAAIAIAAATPALYTRRVSASSWTPTHGQANPNATSFTSAQTNAAGLLGSTDSATPGATGGPDTGLPPYLALNFIIKT